MIVRIITPLSNTAGTLSVIAVDESNNVVIKNIVENVAGTPSNDLNRQLWEFTTAEPPYNNNTFKNVFTGTYLSCANGTDNSTPLTLVADGTRESSNWFLIKQGSLPNDDAGAPRSYAIGTLIDNTIVIDLSGANTVEGTVVFTYTWKGNPPYDNHYNQFWYLEEPRIEVHNQTGKPAIVGLSNDTNEVIEIWDAMVGGNLLGSLNENLQSINVLESYTTFYISSKRFQNGFKVNESENEQNQIIDLSSNSTTSVQFYYDDPKAGAKVTVGVTT